MNKDRFSTQASQYAAFRPTYPQTLYDVILHHVTDRQVAWDCACGNGQVARDLAPHFNEIYATDSSASQIEHAIAKDNIIYSVSDAEGTSFRNNTFDLITVGQALHWFEIPKFFKEATRVAKPDAVLAIWGYSLLSINKPMDKIIQGFYKDIIGPYWDKERKLVDDQYRSISFPFERIPTPDFQFSFQWTIEEFAGYISTWSSVQKYVKQNRTNPLTDFIAKLKPLWKKERYEVKFPLFVMMGRIKK